MYLQSRRCNIWRLITFHWTEFMHPFVFVLELNAHKIRFVFFQYFAICSFCKGNALVSEILSDSVKLWDAPFASPLSTCTWARPAEKSRLIHLRNLHCYSSNISTQFGFLPVHPIYMLFILYQTLPISLFPKKIENWQKMLVSEFSLVDCSCLVISVYDLLPIKVVLVVVFVQANIFHFHYLIHFSFWFYIRFEFGAYFCVSIWGLFEVVEGVTAMCQHLFKDFPELRHPNLKKTWLSIRQVSEKE